MRELVLGMSMSLDGFVSGPAGEADWIRNGDQEAIAWKVERAWNASLHIMGGRSFQTMAGFYPTATMVFAPPMNEIPKAVFSQQGPAILEPAARAVKDAQAGQLQPGAESWAEAYVATGDLSEEIARLKAGGGKPIVAHGGATFARSLIAQNLVDEYVLMVYPIVLGTGRAIFTDLPAPRPLRLISSKTFPSGTMAQIYRPA